MRAVVWLVDESWEVTIDAATELVPQSAETTLLYVVDQEIPEIARGAFAALIGRGRRETDPGLRAEEDAERAAREVLERAGERFGRPAERLIRAGRRIEQEVVDACADADLLVLARDGDRSRVGPRSFGRASRFVVDHAPTRVLVVWAVPGSEISTDRPPPPHDRPPPPHDRPPPPHDRPPPPHDRPPPPHDRERP
jgi:nucleotide-binding universal stress UspA family protein